MPVVLSTLVETEGEEKGYWGCGGLPELEKGASAGSARQLCRRALHQKLQRSGLLLKDGVVDRHQGSDGSARQNALVAAVDRALKASNRLGRQEATECDALSIDDERDESLDNAESQRVNVVLSSLSSSLSTRARALVVGCAEVEEVANDTGNDQAGQGPGEERRPEARCHQKESIGQLDGPVRSTKEADSRDGESVTARQDLVADTEELPRGDNSKNTADSAQAITSGLSDVADSRVLVDGVGTLAQGKSRAINGVGNISRSGGQGNAGGDLGQATTRGSNHSSCGAGVSATCDD